MAAISGRAVFKESISHTPSANLTTHTPPLSPLREEPLPAQPSVADGVTDLPSFLQLPEAKWLDLTPSPLLLPPMCTYRCCCTRAMCLTEICSVQAVSVSPNQSMSNLTDIHLNTVSFFSAAFSGGHKF